jgi:hypothetical protein
MKPEGASSKDEPKTVVETTDYGLKVRITKFSDGSQVCDVGDVTIEDPLKDNTPNVSVATPSSAAPRELPAGKDAECSTCKALEAALREKIEAPAASRQISPSLSRRLSKS